MSVDECREVGSRVEIVQSLSPWFPFHHQIVFKKMAAIEMGFTSKRTYGWFSPDVTGQPYCVDHATQVSLFPGLHSANQCHAHLR